MLPVRPLALLACTAGGHAQHGSAQLCRTHAAGAAPAPHDSHASSTADASGDTSQLNTEHTPTCMRNSTGSGTAWLRLTRLDRQ